jgi:hypothetical protein
LLGITSANVLSQSAGGVTNLAEKLRTAEGAAASTAKAMDAGLGGSMRIAMSAIEGTALAIGDSLAPALQKLIDGIARTAGDLTHFIKQNQGVVIAVAQVVAGVTLAGAAMIVFGKALTVVAGALGLASAAGTTLVTAATMLATTSAAAVTGLGTLLGTTTKLIAGFASMAAGATVYAARAVAAAASSAAAWIIASGPLGIITAMLGTMGAMLLPALAMEAGKAFGRVKDAASSSVAGFDEIKAQFAPLQEAFNEIAGTAIKAGGRIYEALSTGDIVGAWAAATTAISQMFVTLGSNWQKYVTNPIKLQGELIATASRENDILEQFSFGRNTTSSDRDRRAMAARIMGTRSQDELNAELAKQQNSDAMAALMTATQSPKDSIRNPALQQLKALQEAEALQRERFGAAGLVSESDRLNEVRRRIDELDAQFEQGRGARQVVRDDVAAVSDVTQILATAKSLLDLQLQGNRIAGLIERDNLTADQERKLLTAFNDASVRLNAIAETGQQTPEGKDLKPEPPPQVDPEELLRQTRQAAADQSEVVGSFSSVGISGMGFGGNLQERQLKALEEIADNTKDMEGGAIDE